MTAQFTNINSGAGLNAGTTLDIGTITEEETISNFGTTAIPITFTGPEGTYTYNLQGGERYIMIRGYKFDTTASYESNLRDFTEDLQKIGNYQNTAVSGAWFTYQNTKSKIKDIYNGVVVKMVDLRISDSNRNPQNVINYVIRLIQTKAD